MSVVSVSRKNSQSKLLRAIEEEQTQSRRRGGRSGMGRVDSQGYGLATVLCFLLGSTTSLSLYALILPATFWKDYFSTISQYLALRCDLFLLPTYLVSCFVVCSILLLLLPLDPTGGTTTFHRRLPVGFGIQAIGFVILWYLPSWALSTPLLPYSQLVVAFSSVIAIALSSALVYSCFLSFCAQYPSGIQRSFQIGAGLSSLLALAIYGSTLYYFVHSSSGSSIDDDLYITFYVETGSTFIMLIATVLFLSVCIYIGLVLLPVSKRCLQRDDELEPLIAAERGRAEGKEGNDDISGSFLTTSALSSHNSRTAKFKDGKKYSSKSSRVYSSYGSNYGGDLKSSSLTRQRVPSEGISLMILLASVNMYSALELSDEESVKAEATAMKRTQMDATYHWTLTCFRLKDTWSVLLKTLFLQMSAVVLFSSTMLVFPFILESSSIPATLVGSQYAIYWPLALMSSYIIADILGRHIGAAFMVNLCKSKPRSETSVVFIVIIITLQLVFVAARSKLLWDFVFVPVYFSSGVTNIANSLGSTVEGCMLAAGTVGFSSGVLGTSNVLVANRVADPHEKSMVGVFSGVCLNIGVIIGSLFSAFYLSGY